jgi:excisionase family DNA binding protein
MKEYLTIDELSHHLGIKKCTLYAKAARGEIPHYKIGRLIRFKISEISKMMDDFRKTPAGTGDSSCKVKNNPGKGTVDVDSIIRKSIDESKSIKV